MRSRKSALMAMVFASVLGAGRPGEAADRPKMATEIPPQITTPDTVNTRLGTLKFFDGYPDADTVQKVYDNLDFIRGVEVFLNAMPGASLYAMREGLKGVGINNSTVGISETLLDSKSLFLMPNTETVYLVGWLDLKDGPMVIETPPNILGFLDDFWFRYIIDMGNAGPDQGKGGKFLVLPPDYKGPVPKGYFVAKAHTYGVWLAARGFLVKGDPKPAVQAFKRHFRMYPLALARKPPKTNFINFSGKAFNTIHASNAKFYEEVDHIVQEEPNAAQDPELLGQLASIGIVKGKPFVPDARMKKILDDAAAVGNATARAVLTAPREDSSHLNADTQWQVGFSGGYEFLEKGVRRLDARVRMFYYATGITPAMAIKMVGVGSQYSSNWRDVNGNPLDGIKTYRLHLPANPPAKDFWSIVSTTIRRARSCRPISVSRASTAGRNRFRKTTTARSISTSGRRRRTARSRTGCRPFRAKVGTRCYVCMDRSIRGSTRAGDSATSRRFPAQRRARNRRSQLNRRWPRASRSTFKRRRRLKRASARWSSSTAFRPSKR
jgi:hypothetical protein